MALVIDCGRQHDYSAVVGFFLDSLELSQCGANKLDWGVIGLILSDSTLSLLQCLVSVLFRQMLYLSFICYKQ